jgi:hypothetical protein
LVVEIDVPVELLRAGNVLEVVQQYVFVAFQQAEVG